ncbi:archaea-specific SMC-related protein [Haladaptatus sp. NG-SE-30]
MRARQREAARVELAVRNIGGIDETTVSFSPGVTILSGRNATNRTSLLQAMMAALGSERASLKGDAAEGSVELELGDETHTRTLTRRNGTVSTSGDPYLDDPELADLFAFLLESNEARRAVARDDDLRDLILRPVDTEAIQTEIAELEAEKRNLDAQLDELESLEREIPALERERMQLKTKIEDTRAELEAKEAELEATDVDVGETRDEQVELEDKLDELRDTRSKLDDVRFDIDTETDSIEALHTEIAQVERQQANLPEEVETELSQSDQQIQTLRERKQRLNSTVGELQTILQFNEQLLDGASPDVQEALRTTAETDSATEKTEEMKETVTDRLVTDAEQVGCWTCGSQVEKSEIQEMVERIRELHRTKIDERNAVSDEIDELEAERSALQAKRRKREETDRRLRQLEAEVDDRQSRLGDLRDEREALTETIEELERKVETLEQENYSELLDLHREANQLEFELDRLKTDLEDVEAEITEIETSLERADRLEAERAEIREELTDLRTRIDQIEAQAVEEFNEHMAAVLDLLDYSNLERIWIERTEQEVRDGRRRVTESQFNLHIIRSTESGTTYEDTIDHLSESEREVTGLVFALAGYLVHDVYESVPFILLDSLEAIDSDRIAMLVDYFSEYANHLVAALLPEDAAAQNEEYERVREI